VTDYAIYMLDPDGIVTSWNPGARRFKGYEASEIIGQHFSLRGRPDRRVAGARAGNFQAY
jgi:PAS domain S-box-containing protein